MQFSKFINYINNMKKINLSKFVLINYIKYISVINILYINYFEILCGQLSLVDTYSHKILTLLRKRISHNIVEIF